MNKEKEAKMKKILAVLLIMSILSLFVGAGSSLAYDNLSVEISDNCVDHSSQFEISFTTSISL